MARRHRSLRPRRCSAGRSRICRRTSAGSFNRLRSWVTLARLTPGRWANCARLLTTPASTMSQALLQHPLRRPEAERERRGQGGRSRRFKGQNRRCRPTQSLGARSRSKPGWGPATASYRLWATSRTWGPGGSFAAGLRSKPLSCFPLQTRPNVSTKLCRVPGLGNQPFCSRIRSAFLSTQNPESESFRGFPISCPCQSL